MIHTKTNVGTSIIISVLSAGIIFPAFSMPVFAQTITPTGTVRNAVKLEARVTSLKARADREIDRRVTSLNNLISRISAMKRVSSDQKTTLTTQIQTEITNLGTLKTKIDVDTDYETLKTDVQSIVKSYRVYLVFMPKIQIMANADKIMDVATQMTTNTNDLQGRIDKAKAAGKDVTAAQTLMNDRTAKIADANTQAQNAINAVTPLTPEGYPGNKTTLQSARDMLKNGRTDLHTALTDAMQVRKDVKALGF